MDEATIYGGGYLCSTCGQWNRTSAICLHEKLISTTTMEQDKIPTAEDLLLEEAKKFSSPLTPEGLQLLVINVANQHAKNHVKAALKAMAENATIEYGDKISDGHYETFLDKKSILNSYNYDNIK